MAMAHEAQLAEQKELTEQERQNRRDAWAASLTAHADCLAVIRATSRAEASLRDQVKHGGRYTWAGFAALNQRSGKS